MIMDKKCYFDIDTFRRERIQLMTRLNKLNAKHGAFITFVNTFDAKHTADNDSGAQVANYQKGNTAANIAKPYRQILKTVQKSSVAKKQNILCDRFGLSIKPFCTVTKKINAENVPERSENGEEKLIRRW